MSTRRTVFAAAIALAVVACTNTPTAVETDLDPQFSRAGGGGRVVQSATGSGQFRLGDGPLRTFSASAVKHEDGTVSGRSQLKNRSAGVTIHTSIDCLFIDGNLAIMSGVITSHSNPDFVGGGIIWAVEDNGQGKNAPADRITFTFRVPLDPDACIPPHVSVSMFAIKGNIQVRG